MIADEFMGVMEALKLALAKKDQEAQKNVENMVAVEGELKKFTLPKDESEQCPKRRERTRSVCDLIPKAIEI